MFAKQGRLEKGQLTYGERFSFRQDTVHNTMALSIDQERAPLQGMPLGGLLPEPTAAKAPHLFIHEDQDSHTQWTTFSKGKAIPLREQEILHSCFPDLFLTQYAHNFFRKLPTPDAGQYTRHGLLVRHAFIRLDERNLDIAPQAKIRALFQRFFRHLLA